VNHSAGKAQVEIHNQAIYHLGSIDQLYDQPLQLAV